MPKQVADSTHEMAGPVPATFQQGDCGRAALAPVADGCENGADHEAAIRRYAVQRRLPERSVEAWLKLGAEGARMLLELSVALKLRTGQLAAVIELVAEIALREGTTAVSVLKRGEITSIAKGVGSAPERASKLLNVLRILRYPELNRALAKLQSAVEALRLPRSVTVGLPKDLSSGQLSIEIRAGSLAELDEAVRALREASARFSEIFDSLEGADEL
jgi:hypothetical protein